MRHYDRVLATVMFSVAWIALSACGKSEPPPTPATTVPAPPAAAAPKPFKVTSIDLGTQVDAAKRVTAPTTSFAPGDTIYVSVASEGSAPSVVLKAKWTYEDGQLVKEEMQTIAPSGPAATEFHISKPTGWPAGRYKVEVTSNGNLAGAKDFEVKG